MRGMGQMMGAGDDGAAAQPQPGQQPPPKKKKRFGIGDLIQQTLPVPHTSAEDAL